MSNDTLHESFPVGGMTVEIHWDSEPDGDWLNPRNFGDNLTEMRHWHRSYDLGDGQIEGRHKEAMERGGFRLLDRYLRLCEGALIVMPLGLLDHSGLHMYLGGGAHWCDGGGWDSGTVGYIYITEERVQDLCGSEAQYRKLEWLTQEIRDAVETYDDYLRGNVYGFMIRNPDGEEVDSCWGFLGDPLKSGCREQATENAEHLERERLIDQEPIDVAEVLAERAAQVARTAVTA